MNIRNFVTVVVFALTFTAYPAFSSTTPNDDAPENRMTEKEYKQAFENLMERIDILKEAKKNAVTKEEKRAVNDEIKEVKRTAKELKREANGYGIYIGSGALIVILLLILLL